MELIKNQCLFCDVNSSVLSNRDSNLYFRLINKNYFELNYVSDLEFKKIYLGQYICVICAFKIENINILINTINHNEDIKKILSNNTCSWCLEHSDTLITNETTTRSFGSTISAFDKVTRCTIGVNSWKICIKCSAAITNWFNLRTVLLKLQKNGPSSLLDPEEASNNLSRTRRISDSSDRSDTKSKSSDKKVSKMPKIRLKLTAKPKSATKKSPKTQKRKIENEKKVENKLKLLKTVEKEDLNLSSDILNDKKMLLSIPYIKIDLIEDDSNEIEVVEASTSREPTKPPKKILKTSLSDEKNSSELKNGDKNNEISPDTLKQQKKPRRLSLVKNSTPKQTGQSTKKGKKNTSKSTTTKSTKNAASKKKSDEIICLDDSNDDVFEPTPRKEKYFCSICKMKFASNCDKKLHELEHNISFSPIIRLTNHDFSKQNKNTILKTIKLTENSIELQETTKNKEENEITPRKRRISLESLSSNEDLNETPKNKSKPARKACKITKTHQEDKDSPTSSKDSLQVPRTKRYVQKEVKSDEDDDLFTKKRRNSLDNDEISDNELPQTKDESIKNEAKKKKLEDTVVMDDSDDDFFKNTSRDSTPHNFDDIFNSLKNDNEQSGKDENLSVKKKSKKSVSFRFPDEEEDKCSDVICLSEDGEVSENKNTAQETPSEKVMEDPSDEIIQERDSLGGDDDVSTKKDNNPSKIDEENHGTNEETPELDLCSSKKYKPSPKSKKGKRNKPKPKKTPEDQEQQSGDQTESVDHDLPSEERPKPSPKSKKRSKSSSKVQTTETHPDANSKEDHDDLSTEEIEETTPSSYKPSPNSKKKATNNSEGTTEIDTNEDQGDSAEVEEQILSPEKRQKPSPKSKKTKSKNKKDTNGEEQGDGSQENEGTKEKEPHSSEPEKDPETLSASDQNYASNDSRGIASPLNKQDEIRDHRVNLSKNEAETNCHEDPEHERRLDEDLDHEVSKEKNQNEEGHKEEDLHESSEEENEELSISKKTKPSPKSKKSKRSKHSEEFKNHPDINETEDSDQEVPDQQNNEENQDQELSSTKKYKPSPKSRKGKRSKDINSPEGSKEDQEQKDDLDVFNKEARRQKPGPKSKKSKGSPNKNRIVLETTTTINEDNDEVDESGKGTEEDLGVSPRPNEDTSLDAESINQTTSNAEENIPDESKEVLDTSLGNEDSQRDTEEPSENLTKNEEGSSDKEESSPVVDENTNSLKETRQRFEKADSIEEIPSIDSIIEETQLELEIETKSSNCDQNSEERHKDSEELQPDEDIIDETLCPVGSSNHNTERKVSNRSIFDISEDDSAKNEDKGSGKCETPRIFEHLPSFTDETTLSDDSFHIQFDTPTESIENGFNDAISSPINEDNANISSKIEENGTVSNDLKHINGNSSNIQSLGVTNQPNEDQNKSSEEIEDISNDINKQSVASPVLSGIRKTNKKDYTAVESFLEDIGA